jgi:hypothetical protein
MHFDLPITIQPASSMPISGLVTVDLLAKRWKKQSSRLSLATIRAKTREG